MKNNKALFAIFKTENEIHQLKNNLMNLGIPRKNIFNFRNIKKGNQDFSQVLSPNLSLGLIYGSILGVTSISIFLISRQIPNSLTLQSQFSNIETIVLTLAFLLFGIIVGAAIGSLVSIGIPETALFRYKHYLESGGILLSVQFTETDSAQNIKKLIETSGGQDIQKLNFTRTWKNISKPK